MNIKNNLMRLFLWSVALMASWGAVSCTDDETSDSPLQLYYMEVSKIAPSMDFEVMKPSFQGPTPAEFQITGVTCDGQSITTDCFTINETTGAVKIQGTDDLALGVYRLSIACLAGGQRCEFPDVLVINMIPALPSEIMVDVPLIQIPFEKLTDIEFDAPTAQLSVSGESVTVDTYSFPKKEGRPAYYDYFKITPKGLISVKYDAEHTFLPGRYELDIVVTTYALKSYTFEKVVCVEFQSAPMNLHYTDDGQMEAGQAAESLEPELIGSRDALTFSIEKVSPQNGSEDAQGQIGIDAKTGKIQLQAENTLKVGAEYLLDIKVKNQFGEKIFKEAFRLKIVDFIAPIENFLYQPFTATHFLDFEVEKDASFKGSSVTFSIEQLPEALTGCLDIDAETGRLFTPKVTTPVNFDTPEFDIPMGTYEVVVKAVNKKNPDGVTATAQITMAEHPNYFTKFGYGNNLGLPLDAGHADQFRFDYGSKTGGDAAPETITLNPALSDIPSGVKVVYDAKKADIDEKPMLNPPIRSFDINSTTGDVTVVFRVDRANKMGAIIVKALVGEGREQCYRTIPLFLSPVNKVEALRYTPFVVKVNPKTGGKSEKPDVSRIKDLSKFATDYIRDAAYFNVHGPETHVSGGIGKDANKDRFLHFMWNKYFGVEDSGSKHGDRSPLSYYANIEQGEQLSNALLYINSDKSDPDNLYRIIVNPGKWYGPDGKPASGFVVFSAPYVVNGDLGGLSASKNKVFPVVVWLDEKF